MARNFQATATAALASGFSTYHQLMTMVAWSYRIDGGGNGNGRIIDNSANRDWQNSDPNNAITFTQVFSVANGDWEMPRPATNEWHHIAVTYDGGSSSNDPLMYIDGVSQTVNEQASGPSGTPVTTNSEYIIGNSTGIPTRNWGGYLAEVAYYNVILNVNELTAMARGIPPGRIRPASLLFYYPIWGLQSPEIDLSPGSLTGTLIGTTQVNHPPVTLFTSRGSEVPIVRDQSFRRSLSQMGARVGSRQIHAA